jgi:hypothetical protein
VRYRNKNEEKQYEEREERKRTQKKKTIEWHKGSKRKGEKLNTKGQTMERKRTEETTEER